YLWTTVKNRLCNHRRDRAGRRRRLVLLNPERSTISPSPVVALIEEQRRVVLAEAIDRLQRGPRLAIQLRLYHDLSMAETIAHLAARESIYITERTVNRYMDKGYASCRRLLTASEKPSCELRLLQQTAATRVDQRLAEARREVADRAAAVNPVPLAVIATRRRGRYNRKTESKSPVSVNSDAIAAQSDSGFRLVPSGTAEPAIRIELRRSSGTAIMHWPLS